MKAALTHGNQLDRLNQLFGKILATNRFQRQKLGERAECRSAEAFRRLPLLTKDELAADSGAHPPFGSNLTYPLEDYTRYHETSGTTGKPLRVLDTAESWDWWGRCWLEVLRAAGVTRKDRVFFAFSFAPFIGFWSAYHGVSMLGAMCIAGGGANSVRRLKLIFDNEASVLICTPTYALHLAEVARREGISLKDSPVRITLHAGEPGASIPNTRRRIAEAWGASVFDHAGATEVGAFGIPDREGLGVFLNELEFIAEVIHPQTLEPVAEGEAGELIVTNLGRGAWPVIRYRTGDLVRPRERKMQDGSTRLFLEGGILGRVDDMITVRGVNVYPSALEDVIRSVAGMAEFRIIAATFGEMDEISIEVEGTSAVGGKIRQEIHNQIGIRTEVKAVDEGSLPRWEAKAKRFQDLRQKD